MGYPILPAANGGIISQGMRPASIITGLVFLAASASAAAAFPGVTIQPCAEMPPAWARQPVTETVWIYDVPADEMTAKCNKEPGVAMFGCTAFANAKHPAVILLNGMLTPTERACTLIYEMAHLKPNNWVDVNAEARATDLPTVKTAGFPGLVDAPHE